tara:strand:+ start:154 stop:306 length:153 start_codon:yes stop_codon:yes gene_type:complete
VAEVLVVDRQVVNQTCQEKTVDLVVVELEVQILQALILVEQEILLQPQQL